MIKRYWIVIVLVLSLFPWSALAEDPKLSAILEGIRKRYGLVPGLTLTYEREVITKSMAMLAGWGLSVLQITGVAWYSRN